MVKKPYFQQHRMPNTKRKRFGLIFLGVVIVLVGIGAAAYYFSNRDSSESNSKAGKTATGYDVNLDPPTEQEKEETEANKEEVSKEQETTKDGSSTPPAPDTTTRQPYITYASQVEDIVEVGGYVLGIFEAGGTCKATFTKGTSVITGTSTGIEDADHTTCPPVSVPVTRFTEKGVWNVTLSYTSKTTNGTSTVRSLTIQ